MAKSTFVTAPSFASSGSVTSINHVPPPVPSSVSPFIARSVLPPFRPLFARPPILAYTRRRHVSCPVAPYPTPIFRHPPPCPISLPSVSPIFFALTRSYTCHRRAHAYTRIIAEVRSSGKNEIFRTVLSDPPPPATTPRFRSAPGISRLSARRERAQRKTAASTMSKPTWRHRNHFHYCAPCSRNRNRVEFYVELPLDSRRLNPL